MWFRKKLYFGALENPEDKRDYVSAIDKDITIDSLPKTMDLSDSILQVKSQGAEGSCVGQAGSSLAEFIHGVKSSARYLYYRGRAISGLVPNPGKEIRGGSVPRDVMKALIKFGICKESLWPYVVWDKTHPTATMDKNASKYKFLSYSSILNNNLIKAYMFMNVRPVMISVSIYDNGYQWYKSIVKKNNYTVTVGKKITGGHGIMIAGFDDKHQNPDGTKGAFKVLNSWGKTWGDSGYAWLPYNYSLNTAYVVNEMPSDYKFELVSQSPYPTLKAGESTILELTLKNVGKGDWKKGSIKIGTSEPKDRPSLLYDSNWIGINRATIIDKTVKAGESYTFKISLTVPKNAKKGTVYKEYFCPLIEGKLWLKNLGIYWKINIKK